MTSPGEHRSKRRSDNFDTDEVALKLHAALDSDNVNELSELLESLPLSEALRELTHLRPEEREKVITALPVVQAAELVDDAPLEFASDLLEHISPQAAANIVDELDSDARADIVAELDDRAAAAILAAMPESDAEQVRRLSAYDPEAAGGLMVEEVLTFRDNDRVGEVFRRLAADDEDFERYQRHHPYILDASNGLIGVVSLPEMLSSRRTTELRSIMTTPMSVRTDTSLDELQDFFDKHAFPAVPVVSDEGTILGVVSRQAVDEAALERAESATLRLQGVVGDELRSMPVLLRSRRRLAWLSVNIVLNIMAASVIAVYEQTLAAVIAIAVFLPMVSDMSGCSGNQAVGVTLRELSLGLVKPVDALIVWLKEISVGVINGITLGVLIGLVCWYWKGNAYLGLVIGLALAMNTVVAVSVGGVIPLLLKKLNQDPAVASGPLLTTITDMFGFFLVLSLATAFMPLLV